jgi:IS30 family transposase
VISLPFKHLNIVEREKLYSLLEQGFSHRKIALVLGRSQSSVSREIEKNTKYGRKYIPFHAHKRAKRVSDNQRYKAPLKGPQVFLYVREKIRLNWSPETIAGRIKLDIPNTHLTAETIYRYIYSSKTRRDELAKYLCRKHTKRRTQTGRSVHKISKIPNAISIDNRAKYINKRIQLGHWESDLMEGPRSSKPVLSVSTERSTRYTIVSKLRNKKTLSKTTDLAKRLRKFPAQIRRSLTLDNGTENTNHTYLTQQLNIHVFFCHPYHSWEKGTVENTIGRIRRYIPKGTDLDTFPVSKIAELEYILNNTPRKCLGYLTPYEKMSLEIRNISKLT